MPIYPTAPTWVTPTSGTYTAASTNMVGPSIFWHNFVSGTWLTATANQLVQHQQAALAMQMYNQGLGQGLGMGQAYQNEPRYEPRAPHIIRPHAEREALWRAELYRQDAEIAHQRNSEAQAQRRAAEERAKELLLEHLTPSQRDTYTKNGWFIVQGGRSGQRYRINTNRGIAGNVDVIDGEITRHRLCAHLDSLLPFGDQIVAQKLMLEFDEDAFVRIANVHRA